MVVSSSPALGSTLGMEPTLKKKKKSKGIKTSKKPIKGCERFPSSLKMNK